MGEPKLNREEFSTADIAGVNAAMRVDGPTLVRDQQEIEREQRGEMLRRLDPENRVREQVPDRGLGERADERDVQRAEGGPMPLFSEAELGEFRAKWSEVQTGFVDEPRQTVEAADRLVASVMQKLAEGFANERAGLEKQWDHGNDVSTEELRIALQRYRSFFDRLLKL